MGSHEPQHRGPQPYLATPSSLYRPSIPFLEQHLESAPAVWTLRILRLFWFLSLLPLHLLAVTASLCTSFPIPLILVASPKYPHWSPAQRFVYPIVSRLVWAVAGAGGLPPEETPEQERRIPVGSRWLQWATGGVRVAVRQDDVSLSKAAQEWVRAEAVDPRGEVVPGDVPCFWLEAIQEGEGHRGEFEGLREDMEVKKGGVRARDGEKAILYFVGGGYIRGNPVEGNITYDLARETGLKVVGANYRKATRPSRAFPASLQDAITAYSHLVLDLGYKEIYLAGDSAGAGLCTTLLLYLSTTLALAPSPPSRLILPKGLVLISPWVDLSLSTYLPHADDLLNPTMLANASNSYLQNLFAPLSPPAAPGSPHALGSQHPFFSPALPSSLPTLQLLEKAYADLDPLRIIVFSGSAELLAPEIAGFVKNLRKVARVETEWVMEKDEVHVFPVFPHFVSEARGRAIARIGRFMQA